LSHSRSFILSLSYSLSFSLTLIYLLTYLSLSLSLLSVHDNLDPEIIGKTVKESTAASLRLNPISVSDLNTNKLSVSIDNQPSQIQPFNPTLNQTKQISPIIKRKNKKPNIQIKSPQAIENTNQNQSANKSNESDSSPPLPPPSPPPSPPPTLPIPPPPPPLIQTPTDSQNIEKTEKTTSQAYGNKVNDNNNSNEKTSNSKNEIENDSSPPQKTTDQNDLQQGSVIDQSTNFQSSVLITSLLLSTKSQREKPPSLAFSESFPNISVITGDLTTTTNIEQESTKRTKNVFSKSVPSYSNEIERNSFSFNCLILFLFHLQFNSQIILLVAVDMIDISNVLSAANITGSNEKANRKITTFGRKKNSPIVRQ
jgi:hypothetical protein